MPLNSSQLAALVERARQKAPPVVAPPPVQIRKLSDNPSKVPKPIARATTRNAATKEPPVPPKPKPEPDEPPTHPTPPTPSPHQHPETAAAAVDDFPIGWELRKESWHFHRRFFRIFRRAMRCGEYSHLLWQIRRGKAEHLWDDCWRVALPDGKPLAVRGNGWKLITVLPRNFRPPAAVAQVEAVDSGAVG